MESERHRVLIIGVGSIGERHLRCFLQTGRVDASFVEINDGLRRTVAERYRIEQSYSDLDQALALDPQVAVIATPAPLHVPLAQRLGERGIHFLIEKPLSISMEGVKHLTETVHSRGIVAAVAYVWRCHPLLSAMRQVIHEDRFGRPVELVAVSGQHFPTHRPAYREIYYTQRATGGGAIQDALTHLLNAGEWLVGPIDRLAVDADRMVLGGVEVEDTVHLLARHGSVMASYSLNQYQAPNEFTMTVVCERGTVRCEFHKNRWRWMTEPGAAWHDEPIPLAERDTMFIEQANRFLNAVEGKASVPCSLSEGIQTLRVNLAALKSVDDGRWETV
jgi:predicted dehydrogenase